MTQELDVSHPSMETLCAISARHRLDVSRFARVESPGVVNAVYLLDERLVLRIPRNTPHSIASTLRESIAAPAARRAGVTTPELVVFDDTGEILNVPYTIYERVPGQPLGLLDAHSGDMPGPYRSLGRDLALLHTRVSEVPDGVASFERLRPPDPRLGIQRLTADGYLSPPEARWLLAWFDHLAPAALVPVTDRFLHADPQPNNVMVDPLTLQYTALIDWGDASWGDPTLEFMEMPLRAVPHALAGYREVTRLERDETAEARVLWYNLLSAFVRYPLPPPLPDQKLVWGAQTVRRLLEIMQFFLECPESRWASLTLKRTA